MVRSGYALAYKKYSSKYINDENFAKSNNLGIHKHEFIAPWIYRRK